jgi:voltage-gated potassium channel Kch
MKTKITGLATRIKLIINKIRWLTLIILANYLLGAWLITRTEHVSFSDARWFSSVTGFTVGFGDIVPQTEAGRDVAQYIMVSNWILFAIMLALIIDVVRVYRDNFSDEEQKHEDAKSDRTVTVLDHILDQLVSRQIIDRLPDGADQADHRYRD